MLVLTQKFVLDSHQVAPHGQNDPTPSYNEPQAAYDHSNPCHIDLGPHANPHDQQADHPSYIQSDTLSTAHPQTSHSTYADLWPDTIPHDQHINQSSHDQHTNQLSQVNMQGTVHRQNAHYLSSQDMIAHSQNMHHSSYHNSGSYMNPDNQSADHPNFSNVFSNPEQLMSVPQAISHPPYYGFDYYYHAGNAYYHAPHPKIPYEQPVPAPHPCNWTHGLFDVREGGDQVKEGPLMGPQPTRNQHDFNRLRYHWTSNRHTPYIASNRYSNRLTPRDIGHGEGPSHSAMQGLPPPVPDAQPVTPVVPPTAPTALSPAPQLVSTSFIPVIFGITDISKVKSAALLQMKCKVFTNSFFEDVDTVKNMAQQSMDAVISHDIDLVAWSKTEKGKSEVDKLSKAFGTIKKTIQTLSRSAVLWGYDLHYILMMEPPKEVKKIVCGLVKHNFLGIALSFGIHLCHFVTSPLSIFEFAFNTKKRASPPLTAAAKCLALCIKLLPGDDSIMSNMYSLLNYILFQPALFQPVISRIPDLRPMMFPRFPDAFRMHIQTSRPLSMPPYPYP
ncbi:hypothetical protein F4604DRAFT_1913560 [Suillus subluteus]|nr:hypothetical protein F4604DRAFT_1913560 [Suillus subluteus]